MRLSWPVNFFQWTILTRKVGQTENVFSVWWRCISRFVRVQDYKSLCAAVMICANLVGQNYIFTFEPMTSKLRSNGGESVCWCTHARCTNSANFVTVQTEYEYMLFYNDLETQQSRSDWPSFWCAMWVHQWVCVCKITSLCVQRLRFVPPWLTSKQTDTHKCTETDRQHFDELTWIAHPAVLITTGEDKGSGLHKQNDHSLPESVFYRPSHCWRPCYRREPDCWLHVSLFTTHTQTNQVVTCETKLFLK